MLELDASVASRAAPSPDGSEASGGQLWNYESSPQPRRSTLPGRQGINSSSRWVFRANRLLAFSVSKRSISEVPITRPLLNTSGWRLSAGCTCRVACKAKPRSRRICAGVGAAPFRSLLSAREQKQIMSQLQLSLLGVPVVQHGERTLTFSTRKALALLVYLAVEGGTHTRKTLSEAFWPELDAEHGRAALRATLLELRKLLERSHGPGERAHLLVERDTLGFDQGSPLLLDLRLVEAASKQVGRGIEPLAGPARGALLAQLEQAMHLASGPFLAGFTLRDSQFFDDWTRQQREYWHLRVHQLFDGLSMLYERAGDGERAIDTVTRWLGFDPLNEEGYSRLMRLRFSQGDRAGALRVYARGRAVLADQLQVEPEPETVALAKRIRHTAPFRSPQVRSLCPPHASPGQPPANLLDGPFLGRTAEFGALIERYQRVHAGEPQLVLLQGESGIGKTRLASEFVGWAQAQGADVLGRQLEQEHAPDDLLSAVWLAELSRLLPELRDRYPDLPVPATDEALGHNRLFEVTARLIQLWATRRPLVLLLDDMQWADTATLDLLLYLARRLAEHSAPILLLLTLRTGADPLPDVQSTWVLALRRMRIPLTALALATFTQEETQQFIQALAWAAALPGRDPQRAVRARDHSSIVSGEWLLGVGAAD